MRVTIFADVDTRLNPYVILFKKTLEGQGIVVSLERRLNFKWLITKGKFCDCIHLQWINQAYIALIPKISSSLIKKMINSRIVRAILQSIRLIHFSSVLLIARLLGKTIVYTVHDLDVYQKQSLRGIILVGMAHLIVFWLSHSIHVHNQYSRRMIETRYKIKNRFSVISHGNFIGYYPNQITRPEARRKLKLPDDAFVYLFLGLLRPYKGLEDLFVAFKKLEHPDAKLLVVGRVFEASNYETELREISRVDSRIKLVPKFIPDEDVQLYMCACDIFVLPYKHITTSGAFALSLSFGRPVVAPAITSFPEVVTTESGILYDASEPNGLASALQEARDKSWSESKILEYARQFDWERLGPKLANLYGK